MLRRYATTRCLTLVASFFASFTGCSSSPPKWSAFSKPSPADAMPGMGGPLKPVPVDGMRPEPPQTVVLVGLTFDVLRVELPRDEFRHSGKIWNHVDELRVAPDSLARLGRNGVRVGVMAPAAWPAVETILTVMGGERLQEEQPTQFDEPLLMSLGPVEEGESIFAYGMSARLAGKTFTAGEKMLCLDYALRPESSATDLQISFEVRHDQGVMTWERRGGIIREVPAIDRHVFDGSVVRLTLAQGETLVISATTDITHDYLLGHRFLLGSRGDRAYETVLFLTPKREQAERGVRFNAERS